MNILNQLTFRPEFCKNVSSVPQNMCNVFEVISVKYIFFNV